MWECGHLSLFRVICLEPKGVETEFSVSWKPRTGCGSGPDCNVNTLFYILHDRAYTFGKKKLTTKCQHDCESYLMIENPTPRHKIMGKKIQIVVLLMECVTSNKIWNKLVGFAWLLEIGNTWLTENGLLVMPSPGDDKPLNLDLFAYLLLKGWFQNSLGSLWK